jgi:hypothetical protein
VATAVALGRKIRTAAPRPEYTTVSVLNGYTIPGAATEARYLLSQRGYRTIDPPPNATGNAPWASQQRTEVYYDPQRKGAEAAARQVAQTFGAAEAVSYVPPKKCTGPPIRQPHGCLVRPLSNNAMLTVVVGQSFHNELAPLPARAQLKRQRPDVRFDRFETAPLVRAQQKQVGFKLMVPATLDRLSVPDSEMPIRTYRITKDRGAVRLVFRRGLEYWGVQQTNWEDAPVLESRNLRRVVNGRAYDLYYRGPKLHMVVLRQNGASYWVVNTLLDSLSNETMLAIAKGLQPLDPPKKPKQAKAAKAKAAKAKKATS